MTCLRWVDKSEANGHRLVSAKPSSSPLKCCLAFDPHLRNVGDHIHIAHDAPAHSKLRTATDDLKIRGYRNGPNSGDGQVPADMIVRLPVHHLLKRGKPIRDALFNRSDATSAAR